MIKKYFSLVKFSHTIFAMPFAIVGFSLGVSEAKTCDWTIFLLIIICMICARNAAMGFNRYADRIFDKKNPRTAIREIPAGKISAKSALLFVIINSILFIFATYFINFLVFCLSPIALLVILGYSLTKRFTALCHFILGLGLSLAPIGSYLCVTGNFAILPIILSVSVLLWSGGFDIIYALQDIDFDRSEKLHSIPAKLGIKGSLILSSIVHFLVAGLIIFFGIYGNFSYIYYIGAGIFIFFLAYQHLIISPTNLSRVNAAFAISNGIASVVFAMFTISDLIFI